MALTRGGWGSRRAPLIGLDIGAFGVRLVELGRARSGAFILERCATEPVGRGCVSQGHLENFDEVAHAVRRALHRSGTRTRQAAMALPTAAVITRKIAVPAGLSELELEAQVEAEASQYIPFPLDEVSLDFCVLGPAAAPGTGIEVLIAASRKDKVQDLQGLAEAAGLRPVILDIDSHACRRAAERLLGTLSESGPEAVVALFDVGATATGLQVLRAGEVLYERDEAFGESELNQLVARAYGLTDDEAARRRRGGDLPADYAGNILQPFVDGLARDMARALEFFFAGTPHHRVDGVLLAGGCADLAGLPQAVARQTRSPCHLADPFAGMQRADGDMAQGPDAQAPAYLTACGLAMRRFLP